MHMRFNFFWKDQILALICFAINLAWDSQSADEWLFIFQLYRTWLVWSRAFTNVNELHLVGLIVI